MESMHNPEIFDAILWVAIHVPYICCYLTSSKIILFETPLLLRVPVKTTVSTTPALILHIIQVGKTRLFYTEKACLMFRQQAGLFR
jgi:hypothetical protein